MWPPDEDRNLDEIISIQDCHPHPIFNGLDSRLVVTPTDTQFEMQEFTIEAWIELPESNRNIKIRL